MTKSCCIVGDKSRAKVKWIGKLQFVGVSREHSVVIDQKVENSGENIGFKPTELLLIALGSCLGTTILSVAKLWNIEISKLELDVEVERSADCCAEWRFTVNVHIDGNISEEDKKKLIKVAEESCKISNILRSSCDVQVRFE